MKSKTNDLSMNYYMNDPLREQQHKNYIYALKEFKDFFPPENIG